MTLTDAEQAALLAQPLTLPCGLKLPNRLVKAAMEEILGTLKGDPSGRDVTLYEEWAQGNWGLVITGNVMVSATHLGSPVDVRVPFPSSPDYAESLDAFKRWAIASHGPDHTPTIIQLCHSGRQSMRASGRPFFEPSKAPSAVGMVAGSGWIGKLIGEVVWGTPSEMTLEDIQEVIEGFVQGARVAKAAGFEGIQIHASHGYLIAQWLSPNVNLRTDEWGGTPKKRMRLLLAIVSAIRKELPLESGFCVGIKLNSSDYVKGGLTEEDALDNVKWIAEHGGVDFIEISGGTYESPKMLQEDHETQSSMRGSSSAPKASTVAREAFFLSFASRARTLVTSLPSESLPSPPPAILLTGGFRTRPSMAAAIASPAVTPDSEAQASDLIGLGRPAAASPRLPKLLLDPNTPSLLARAPKYSHKAPKWLTRLPLPLFMPGLSTIFHTLLMAQIAKGERPAYEMTLMEGLWAIWFRPALQALRSWLAMVSLALIVGGFAWVRA